MIYMVDYDIPGVTNTLPPAFTLRINDLFIRLELAIRYTICNIIMLKN